MGTLYKITDKVWGISDMPWPLFLGIQGFVILKIIIGGVLLCLASALYPLLYIFGVGYLIRKKKKPNWWRFALYTALMAWYVFAVVKYLVLGYPMQRYSDWPSGDKPVFSYNIPENPDQQEMVWRDGGLVPLDDRLEISDTGSESKHFRLAIRDGKFEYDWLNRHRAEQNLEPVHLTSRQINNLEGVYEWYSKILFTTQAQLLNYICTHYDEMQKYKVKSDYTVSRASGNEIDEYNDRLDDYLSDPEDEIEFRPEIFDFQDD